MRVARSHLAARVRGWCRRAENGGDNNLSLVSGCEGVRAPSNIGIGISHSRTEIQGRELPERSENGVAVPETQTVREKLEFLASYGAGQNFASTPRRPSRAAPPANAMRRRAAADPALARASAMIERDTGWLFVALGAYAAATYIASAVNCLADEWAVDVAGAPPLPDVGHRLTAEWRNGVWFVDGLARAQYALLGLRMLIAPRRRKLFAHFVALHTALLLLRCATVPFTTVPAPAPCEHVSAEELAAPVYARPLYHLRRADALISWCHDMMYSGHVALVTLAALFHSAAPPNALYAWRIASLSIVVASVYALLAARVHYSMDIAVALVVTVLLFEHARPTVAALFRPPPPSHAPRRTVSVADAHTLAHRMAHRSRRVHSP